MWYFYKKYEWQKYKLSFKILHKLYMTDQKHEILNGKHKEQDI